MPRLDWIGRSAVEGHHREVPYHLIHCDRTASAGDPEAENILLRGDNLVGLKALLPFYGGRVKVAYLDPPYNTGNQVWRYNDAVNSPEIREWLGRAVGAEAEDLTRHDKWLCMMYPRLRLVHEMLRDDGVVFVSIDDVEVATLRLLLDEIFGRRNYIGTIVWKNVTDNNPTRIASEHEYVLCYAKDLGRVSSPWKSTELAVKTRLLQIGREFIAQYPEQEERQSAYTAWFRRYKNELWPFDRYKFIDEGGIYTGSQSVHNPGKEGYRYDVPHPVTGRPCVQPLMGYRFPEHRMKELVENGRILFGEDENKLVELKVYASEYRAKLSSFFELDGRTGTNQLKAVFPENRRPFDFPKPLDLVEELLSFTSSEDDIVLDCFAGSGTTGHAVLRLNRADGGNRRFVLLEMDEEIAEEITSVRITRAIEGYHDSSGSEVAGLGNGVRVCKLGESLFDSTGQIRGSVRFSELAAHVYFMATGTPLPRRATGRSPMLGVSGGTAVYLLFNGILGDARPQSGNVLSKVTLGLLPAHNGPRVVYGEACTLGEQTLRRARISFRQLPYSIG